MCFTFLNGSVNFDLVLTVIARLIQVNFFDFTQNNLEKKLKITCFYQFLSQE